MAEPEGAVKKKGKGKGLVLGVVALLVVGGGTVGAAKFGVIQIPGLSPKKGAGPAPTELKAVPGDGRVVLTWTPVKGATTYTVRRGDTDKGPFKDVKKDLKEPKLVDQGLKNGAEVVYVVVAMHPKGASLESEAVKAKPVAPPRKPAPELAGKPAPPRKKGPVLDPVQGAETLAALWNQMEPGDLVRLTASWSERDLARVMAQMNGEQAAALLSEVARAGSAGATRASRLSQELLRLGSVVEPTASSG